MVSAGVIWSLEIYIAFDIPEPTIHLSIAVENGESYSNNAPSLECVEVTT